MRKKYLITIEGTGNDTNTGKYTGQIKLEQNIELSEMEEGFTWYIDQAGEIAKTNVYDFSNDGLKEVDVILKLGFYSEGDETKTITSFQGSQVPEELPKEITSLDQFFFHNENEAIKGIQKWDTSNVTNMNEMFSDCYSLASLDLINWNTSNVTEMFGMFANCRLLTSLNIGGWDTSSVINMNDMFFCCSNLIVDCSAWNVGKVSTHTNFNNKAPEVIPPTWWNEANIK